jgi:hypothetical protein
VVNVTVKTKRGPGGAEVPGGPEMEERFKEFFGQEFFDRFFGSARRATMAAPPAPA